MKKTTAVLATVIAVTMMASIASAAFVTDGLVVYLDSYNADGAGNDLANSTTPNQWINLAGTNNTTYTGGRASFAASAVGTGVPTDPYSAEFRNYYVVSEGKNVQDGLEFDEILGLSEQSITYEFFLKTKTWISSHKGALIGESDGVVGYTRNYLQVQDKQYTGDTKIIFDQYWPGGDTDNYAEGVPVDEWWHCVCTHDADTLKFYVNGKLFASMYNTEVYNDSNGDPTHAITKAWIGNRPEIVESDGFEGNMGIVRAYDRPLTAADVVSNFMNDKDRFGISVSILPGDANADGVVDENDAAILADNWLTTGIGWGYGDFSGDGVVDDVDATILAVNWRSTSADASNVPEPGILGLALGGMVMIFIRRMKK